MTRWRCRWSTWRRGSASWPGTWRRRRAGTCCSSPTSTRAGVGAGEVASCAAWLSWKCQVAPGTAREQVRVARAITGLPVIRREFAAGRFSYAKVRALTRIATPDTEADLADMAECMTAGQLERFAAAHRRVTRGDDARQRPRKLTWRVNGDGTLTITATLAPQDGAVVLQALRASLSDLDHPHDGQTRAERLAQRDAANGTDLQSAAGRRGLRPPGCRRGPGRRAHRGLRQLPAGQDRHRRQPRRLPGHHPRRRRRHHRRRFRGTRARMAARRAAPLARHPPRARRPLPPRRRPRPQPRRPAAHRLQRHHRRHGPRRQRHRPCRRPPHPQAAPRPAPGRPGTRPPPLPLPRMRIPQDRPAPHPALGQRRPHQPGQPHQPVPPPPHGHPRQGLHHHPHRGLLHRQRPAHPAQPAPPHADGDITTSHDADITYHTIVPPHSGERLNLHEAIWVCFVQAEQAQARAAQREQLSQAA